MMQTRKRVLINAFTVRALRDTFSPARGAGERVLSVSCILSENLNFFIFYFVSTNQLISLYLLLLYIHKQENFGSQVSWHYVPPAHIMTLLKLQLGYYQMLLCLLLILTGMLSFYYIIFCYWSDGFVLGEKGVIFLFLSIDRVRSHLWSSNVFLHRAFWIIFLFYAYSYADVNVHMLSFSLTQLPCNEIILLCFCCFFFFSLSDIIC